MDGEEAGQAMRPRIMVVEDESIVAQDLVETLEELGYIVPAVAASGEDAVARATETKPDLVLMDIRLRGQMSGIDAALRLRSTMQLPVVFLTAYADDETLAHAQDAEPFGYLLKPFTARGVHSAVVIALRKAAAEARLATTAARLNALLQSMPDGVVGTDPDGRIVFMNPAAENLTGWRRAEAVGREAEEVIPPGHAAPRAGQGPSTQDTRAGTPSAKLILRRPSGTSVPIELSTSPVASDVEAENGSVLIFRDISERIENGEDFRREPAGAEAAPGPIRRDLHAFLRAAVAGPLQWVYAAGILIRLVCTVLAVGLRTAFSLPARLLRGRTRL